MRSTIAITIVGLCVGVLVVSLPAAFHSSWQLRDERAFQDSRDCTLEVLEVTGLSSSNDPLRVLVDGTDCGYEEPATFSYVGVSRSDRRTEGPIPAQVTSSGRIRHAGTQVDEDAARGAVRLVAATMSSALAVGAAAGGYVILLRRRRGPQS